MAARTASCGPRLFTLSGCVNRWLWSDSTHRRLGVLAFGAALTAYASGLLGWRALPPLVARCCAGLVALIGASTLGGHGARVRDDPRSPEMARDGPSSALSQVEDVGRDRLVLPPAPVRLFTA